MYKLRRSRFLKLCAGFLVLLLSAAIVFNVVGTIILMDENLYYASRQQLQQKVYSYVYEFTASDLMRYLNRIEDMNTIDSSYHNYNDSEIQLYRSKYSLENSNIYFEIRDENNNLLLSNENFFENEPCFTFSQVFINHYSYHNYYDNWYIKGDSYSDGVTSAETVSVATTSLSESSDEVNSEETEATTSFAAYLEEVYDDTYENETAFATIVSEKAPLSADKNSYQIEEYDIINNYSGNTVNLHYYYSKEINPEILNYCKEFLQTLPYDITEFSFRQEEYYTYTYSETFEDEYTEIFPTYNASDSVPANSFKTKLLTDGKEIELTYTYKGTLVFSEFRDRLKYICLAANNSENESSYSYMQKGNSQIYITVNVPIDSRYAKDAYYYAEIAVDAAMVYKNNIIPITVFYFLTLIVCLIYIFWSAGYIPKKDEPAARGLHAIPFDLYLILSILAGIGCFALACTYDELFIILGCTGLVFIVLFFIYTLPVRIRAKKLRSNNITVYIVSAIKKSFDLANTSSRTRITLLLCILAFILITVAEIILYLFCGETDAATITLLAGICKLPLIFLVLIILIDLHNGARAISKGDTAYRIKNSLLFGPFKRHAQYLNSINDGVNKAVEERMRSESLKTELITNVSHDLKTPLTSIVNYIDLLKKTEVKNEQALQYIDVIDRQAQRLKKLTIDIVEASKAATGNIEVNYENTALNVILLQTNGEYIERLQEKNLTLVQEIPEEDIIVSTDGRLLWRVIDNLMNNICKYSMPGTRVYLTLWENNGRAFISFRNISRNKLGISPENLTERFVRGDSSRNTEGSGLGLSIANSLTEIMGGKLSIIIDGDLFKVTLSFPTIGNEE